MLSVKSGWRRPRLSIRSLMIGVAVVALAFATSWVYLPWLRWRLRVDRIIDKKLAGRDRHRDIFFDPTYEKYYDLTGPEYQDVVGDPRYVAERLLETSAKDGDPQRRAEAFSALRRLLVETSSPAVAREFLGRVLRQAVAGTLSPGDEQAAVSVVIDLVSYLGLDEAQRAAILARARKLARGPDPGRLMLLWVILIDQIGGAAETEFLLELEDARDPGSFTVSQDTRPIYSRSPALLDHIRRWLNDPARALGALDYTILPFTAQGRRLLLDVVLAPGRDDNVRRKAIRLLKRDRTGVELLLQDCENPDHRRILGKLYGPDRFSLNTSGYLLPAQIDKWPIAHGFEEAKRPDDIRPELQQLRDHYDVGFDAWFTFTRGLNLPWSSLRRWMLKRGKTQAEADRAVHEAIDVYLTVARELSGQSDLGTLAEWDEWYRAARPKPISQARWLQRMLAHPDLVVLNQFHEIYVIPSRSVAPELVDDYAKLVRAVPAGSRWRLCLLLLLYCDRVEEAPLLIDDIEQELRDHPVRFGDRNLWPIRILRYRFGVNYFWDVAAWRRWWTEYQGKAIASPAGTGGRANGHG
jgi:hypothetical protein